MHSVIWKIGRALELLYEAGAACSASVRRCIKGASVHAEIHVHQSLDGSTQTQDFLEKICRQHELIYLPHRYAFVVVPVKNSSYVFFCVCLDVRVS